MNNPTDTNQASELFELCKEVYRRTGWDSTEKCYAFIDEFGDGGKHWRVIPLHEDNVDDVDDWHPLYTSDYLLEKLPPVVQDSYDKKFRHIQMWINGDGEAIACYVEPYDKEFKGAYPASSDSMLKALLKLTIALSEAGELK